MDDTEPVPGVEHRERRTARTARLRAGRGHVDQPRLHGGRPDRLARKAALTSRWRFLPIADRIEIARFAPSRSRRSGLPSAWLGEEGLSG